MIAVIEDSGEGEQFEDQMASLEKEVEGVDEQQQEEGEEAGAKEGDAENGPEDGEVKGELKGRTFRNWP